MKLTEADQIWNRAALESGGRAPLEGDRSLADLLLAHGLVMNGGVEHMIQAVTSAELSAAIKGFRYFGLDEIALLLENSVNASESQLERADSDYCRVANDQVIAKGFKDFYFRNPKAFASTNSETISNQE
jgi:hypothetical protein